MRLILCSYMFVLFSLDLAAFVREGRDEPVERAFVFAQYLIFLMVVVLSWVFIWNGIKDAKLDQLALKKLRQLSGGISDGGARSSTRQPTRTPSKKEAVPGRVVRTGSSSKEASPAGPRL